MCVCVCVCVRACARVLYVYMIVEEQVLFMNRNHIDHYLSQITDGKVVSKKLPCLVKSSANI